MASALRAQKSTDPKSDINEAGGRISASKGPCNKSYHKKRNSITATIITSNTPPLQFFCKKTTTTRTKMEVSALSNKPE
ncbi:hypothetical protein ACTJKN_02655 [Pedobacter sp. 22163]|uniref:hypothetical protein n=1 Tax=Pedobacter sp. 22163 TaxID=3453883 RepID=UPI003F828C68